MQEDLKKVSPDHISKVIDCIWTGAHCECCGYYDDWTTNLDCGCQTWDGQKYNEGDLFRCPTCSGDDDEEREQRILDNITNNSEK